MFSEISSSIDYNEYENLVNNTKNSTFYNSKNHLKFLESIIKIKPNFIIVKENNKLIGAMPFFEKKEKYGIVINSLPFFGSYGGTISNETRIDEKIINELNDLIKNKDILSSVIIDNPFYPKNKIYEENIIFNVSEKRLIQSTPLKNKNQDEIWKKFDKRVRWSIKKSEKNDIKIISGNNDKLHMKKFYELHVNSMKMKGGKSKPKNIFEIILKEFTASKDYDIFVAMKGAQSIAYILVFYHKDYAEYYLPAYDPEFLSLQSTSQLIWESMKIAQNKKISNYNFGGTWKTQTDLYRFKKGWNAKDFDYRYFINRNLDEIRKIGIEKIVDKYEYFYICPFDEI